MIKCQRGCNRSFSSKDALGKHCEARHSIFQCTVSSCKRDFTSAVSRNDHENSHLAATKATAKAPSILNGYYPCVKCLKSFQTAEGRDHHREVAHGVAKPAVRNMGCNDCGKTFPGADALRQHQHSLDGHTRLASGLGSLQCNNCNRTLRNHDALEQHFVADHSLIKIDSNSGIGAEIIQAFLENWLHPTTSGPKVICVYEIYNLGWRKRKFESYRDGLPGDGNMVDRYHGTTVKCQLGAGILTKLCQDIKCGLCGIIRSGFRTAKANRKVWQRFGAGIYTSGTSSKSIDYVKTSSTRRAILVCKVLAGNVYQTWNSMKRLLRPPDGFDSVSGEVGEDLNYDETVVYRSRAILPKFMIIYEVPSD